MAGNIGWNPAPAGGNMMASQQAGGNSMIVFINDDSVAMNYPIAPGYTVALVNANDPSDGKLFIRSAEANGMPKPARVFAIKEITPKSQDADTVSRKEFDDLTSQFASMSGQVQQILSAVQQLSMTQAPAVAPAVHTTKGGTKK